MQVTRADKVSATSLKCPPVKAIAAFGPSRTGDTIGAHGPCRVHLVVVA
jgi:L-lactate utilization protein LutC